MSQLMGPALLVSSSKWRHRVEKWKQRIQSHEANLISYLIVLRIAPLPPHWMVNLIAPHLGITFWMFWVSTFLGVCGVSYIVSPTLCSPEIYMDLADWPPSMHSMFRLA